MYKDKAAFILTGNPHFLKAGNGGKAVSALEKAVYFGSAFSERAEHDCPVGN